MAITRFKNSSIANKGPKYDNALAGLPYIPIIGTATDGGNGTSASVAFTGNNSAGAGITYTALSSPGSFTGTGTASPITVSGLTAGTAYTFQVKAGNSLGDSAYSAASNSVTPVQPTAFESIASTTLTSATSTITFSSIPSTYQHLQVRIIAKNTNTSTTSSPLNIFFNNTTSSWSRHALYGDGSAAYANGASSQGTGYIGWFPNNGSGSTSMFGAAIIDIHDYASTTKNKTIRVFAGSDTNNVLTDSFVYLASGAWQSTNAINRIDINDDNGYNLAIGTTVSLYGIKG